MKNIKRYLRIYRAILKINLVYLLTYRANFINNIVSALGWGAFQIVWIVLLTGKRGTAFGWTQDDMIFLTLGYFMVLGIFHFIFTRNFDTFSRIVDRGELDAILLKPIDSQFHSTMRIVNYANLVRAIVGIVLIIIWSSLKHYHMSPIDIVFFCIYVGVGVMTMYSIWLIFVTMIIWYPNLSNMVDLLFTINGFARYPVEMVRNSGKIALYIFIPLLLSISAPIKILIHKNATQDIITLTLICIGLFMFSRWLWKWALRYYTSAS